MAAKSIKHLLILLVFSAHTPALAGGWSGNGGHVNRDQDNVWFLGDEPVSYCLSIDAGFPFSPTELHSLVEESLREWNLFFHRYGLDRAAFGNPGTLAGEFPDGMRRQLSLNFLRTPFCDQPEEQLQFQFGGTPDDLATYLEHHPNEIAAAIRGPYNHATYRTGGYIWLRSEIPEPSTQKSLPWTRSTLKHMLLHELGHIFGMPHDSVHVMAGETGQDIAEYASHSSGNTQSPRFGVIESPRWHYRYLIGDKLNLCQSGGGAFHIPEESCWNGHIPEYIRSRSGIDGNGHHQRTIEVISKNLIRLSIQAVNTDGQRKDISIDIPIDGHLAKLVFDRGPGIYTLWNTQSGNPTYHRAGLDFTSALLPHQGTANLQGEAFGVQWQQGKGLLYIPQSQEWWEFTDPVWER